jgi:hypothetical protein
MNFISVPVVISILTYGIYKLFKLFVCRRERLNIIDKLSNDQFLSVPDSISLPYYSQPRISFGALKSGCLLLGVGLGLLIGFIVCATCIPDYFGNSNWDKREVVSIVYGSCILIFGGVGLITAFIIELKIGKKKKD